MANITLTLPEALKRAIAAYNDGKFSEAERLCRTIIAAKPGFFDALHLLAVVQTRLGRLKDALTSYDQALTVRPDYAEALSNRGLTLHELRRFEDALASYDQALTVRPDYAEALSNRGLTLHELTRFEDALASYDQALAVRPNFAEAFFNRGNALLKFNRIEEALASYEQALAARPDYVEALNNRGHALYELRRFEEGLASYDRALTLRPDYAETLNNRGNALRELKRFEEALASYERALTMRPDYVEALSNRGLALYELRRFDEALASYDHALTLRPDYAAAHFNEANCRLVMGDFDHGWKKFEWRSNRNNFAQPVWLGSNQIAGKTILLHARPKLGFGDTIQFCRYVPLVAKRAARVILEVQAPLHGLMSTLCGAAQILARGDPLPEFDIHCPLLSLPLAFGTRLETIPSATPYLHVSSQAMMNWNARLGGPRGRPRIGLAWSGDPMNWNDHRSIRLGSLLSLLDLNATFVSLQKDVRANDAAVLKARSDVLHFGDELKDFSDTAALISNLDLVISVDTSVAHLAGALAKPVWVMLPFIGDWRWLLDREDSPWYPTARLFRQDDSRAWESVIVRVRAALQDFLRNYVSKPAPAACSG